MWNLHIESILLILLLNHLIFIGPATFSEPFFLCCIADFAIVSPEQVQKSLLEGLGFWVCTGLHIGIPHCNEVFTSLFVPSGELFLPFGWVCELGQVLFAIQDDTISLPGVRIFDILLHWFAVIPIFYGPIAPKSCAFWGIFCS